MPVGNTARQAGASCYDRMKMAAFMGFGIGLTAGMLFGGIAALRHGVRGRALIPIVGKNMLQSGGTFGTFMAIGTGIRC